MSTIVSSLDRERLETVLGPEQADGWLEQTAMDTASSLMARDRA